MKENTKDSSWWKTSSNNIWILDFFDLNSLSGHRQTWFWVQNVENIKYKLWRVRWSLPMSSFSWNLWKKDIFPCLFSFFLKISIKLQLCAIDFDGHSCIFWAKTWCLTYYRIIFIENIKKLWKKIFFIQLLTVVKHLYLKKM